MKKSELIEALNKIEGDPDINFETYRWEANNEQSWNKSYPVEWNGRDGFCSFEQVGTELWSLYFRNSL
jgi:hypothetical protein